MTKIKSKPQQQKDSISFKYLTIETIGNILIYLSGILPFIHVLVEDNPLPEKFFGYSSVHRFLYSAGTHASLLSLCIGLLFLITFLSEENVNHYKKSIKYSLLSPFISAVFFMCWVMIPDVNFNILSYLFIGLCVSGISVFLMFKLLDYVNLLRLNSYIKRNY